MNAAASEEENNAERGTGAPAPALVPVRTRKEPEGTVTSRGYTWLSEDEEVWGTEPALGPAVLGRDFPADEEDFDSYDEFDEPAQQPARDRAPTRGRSL